MGNWLRSLLRRTFPRLASSLFTTLKSVGERCITTASCGIQNGQGRAQESLSASDTILDTTPRPSSGRIGPMRTPLTVLPRPPGSRVVAPGLFFQPTAASLSTGRRPTGSLPASLLLDSMLLPNGLIQACESYARTHRPPYCLSCSIEGRLLLVAIGVKCGISRHSSPAKIMQAWRESSAAWNGSGEERTSVQALFDAGKRKPS